MHIDVVAARTGAHALGGTPFISPPTPLPWAPVRLRILCARRRALLAVIAVLRVVHHNIPFKLSLRP
eukprot:COSAG06_NODE_31036_length_527_cov_136.306075_1_plen_66_part_10